MQRYKSRFGETRNDKINELGQALIMNYKSTKDTIIGSFLKKEDFKSFCRNFNYDYDSFMFLYEKGFFSLSPLNNSRGDNLGTIVRLASPKKLEKFINLL